MKTTSTLKRWEHEIEKFEIAVYTGTREIAKLNTANPVQGM